MMKVLILIVVLMAGGLVLGQTNSLPPHSPTPMQMMLIEGDIPFDPVIYESLPAEVQSITPSVPPSRFPPMPVPTPDGKWSTGADNVYTAFVMSVEYQTNGIDGTILEYQFVPVTNHVPRYPKLLYVQATFCETVDGEYKEIGQEMVFKLGDTTNGFYTAELRIE